MNAHAIARSAARAAAAAFVFAAAPAGAADAVASPIPSPPPSHVKAKALAHPRTIRNAQETRSLTNGGFKLQTGLKNASTPHSGRDCIASGTAQQVAQSHANTGQPGKDIVDVPIDGSQSVQSASSRARFQQECAKTAP